MPVVSEKMSVAPKILRKVVPENVTTSPRACYALSKILDSASEHQRDKDDEVQASQRFR